MRAASMSRQTIIASILYGKKASGSNGLNFPTALLFCMIFFFFTYLFRLLIFIILVNTCKERKLHFFSFVQHALQIPILHNQFLIISLCISSASFLFLIFRHELVVSEACLCPSVSRYFLVKSSHSLYRRLRQYDLHPSYRRFLGHADCNGWVITYRMILIYPKNFVFR